MAGKAIILGEGVFAIGATDIGLTRGGGQFTVERENRQVNADGDRGPVKGRIRITGSTARLVVNQLEILAENLTKMFPGTKLTTDNGTDTWTGKQDIEDTDYNDTVTWTGRTMDGRACVITIKNAINLENIDWSMVEKDEVVSQLTYTATYEEEDRLGEEEPWEVKFTDTV